MAERRGASALVIALTLAGLVLLALAGGWVAVWALTTFWATPGSVGLAARV